MSVIDFFGFTLQVHFCKGGPTARPIIQTQLFNHMSKTKILTGLSIALLFAAVPASAQLTLPFVDSFTPDSPIGLDTENPRWTVIDNNGDGYMYTWSNYIQAGMGGEPGYVECLRNYQHDADDYLASHPITIEAGDVHLSFYYRTTSEAEPEAFDVLFGKAGAVQSLPVIKSVDRVDNPEWKLMYIDIDVPETGEYILAFHCRSTTEGQMLRIDELEMDYGKYRACPDISATGAELPISGHAFDSPVALKLSVVNRGAAAAGGFDASYSLNDGAWVTQHFTTRLEPDQEVTVEFDAKASFATPDTRYNVRFKAECDDDMWSFNNECAGVVYNVAPKTVPYTLKFADVDRESTDLFWWPSDFGQQGWSVAGNYYKPSLVSQSPLVSGGVAMEPGDYKLILKCCAGSWGWPDNLTCDYTVRMGITGTDVSQWPIIVDSKGVYTNDATRDIEHRFTVTEAGSHSFALFVTDNPGNFEFYGFSVQYANPDDVAVSYGSPWPMGDIIPASMLSRVAIPVTVTNTGRTPEEVTVSATVAGRAAGNPLKVSIGVQQAATVELPLDLGNVAAGDNITVTVAAAIDAEDGTPDDNTFDLSFTVSDEELRRDNISTFTKPIMNGEPGTFRVGFGSAFHIVGECVLSHIDLALAAVDDDKTPFTVNVYKINGEGVSRLLASNSLERGPEAGLKRFVLTPMRLEAGDYFFEVVQASGTAIGLCYESVEGGSYQVRNQWVLNPDLFDPDEISSTEGVNLGIRPVFADGADAPAVNLHAVKFDAPLPQDLMYSDETITAVYSSLGYGRLENVVFNCLVDGVPVASTTVPVIEPYQLNFAIDFKADLTAVGEHTITVMPSVSGDADPGDNIITLRVNSVAEVDRYSLDFESCNDFASRFNPSWYTVDGDGVPTNGYVVGGFSIWWPGCDQPFGFIAFNPDETIPVAPGFFEGYSGKRFGASFFTSTGVASDDWLISPALALDEGSALKFRCKSQTDKYGMEEYYVLISPDGSTDLDDFVPLGDKRFAPAEWDDVEVDLSDYAGTSPRLAIRCVSQDKFIFLVDDINVTRAESSVTEARRSAAGMLWDTATQTLHVAASGDITVRRIDVYTIAGVCVAAYDTDGGIVNVSLDELIAGTYICRAILSDGTVSTIKIAAK